MNISTFPTPLNRVLCFVLAAGLLGVVAASAQERRLSAVESEKMRKLETRKSARQLIVRDVVANRGRSSEIAATLRTAGLKRGDATRTDADVAATATEIGFELRAIREGKAARSFFAEAERAFTRSLPKLRANRDESLFSILYQRAHLRGRLLGDPNGAMSDMQEAFSLRKEDPPLEALYDQLAMKYPEVIPLRENRLKKGRK